MIIDSSRKFRVTVAKSKGELRAPNGGDTWYTGSLKTAHHGGASDALALGDGAAYVIDKERGGLYDSHEGGEVVRGRVLPRNNF